jgi:hypothetical protein
VECVTLPQGAGATGADPPRGTRGRRGNANGCAVRRPNPAEGMRNTGGLGVSSRELAIASHHNGQLPVLVQARPSYVHPDGGPGIEPGSGGRGPGGGGWCRRWSPRSGARARARPWSPRRTPRCGPVHRSTAPRTLRERGGRMQRRMPRTEPHPLGGAIKDRGSGRRPAAKPSGRPAAGRTPSAPQPGGRPVWRRAGAALSPTCTRACAFATHWPWTAAEVGRRARRPGRRDS